MDEDFDMPPPEEMNEDFGLPDASSNLKVGEEKEIGEQGLKKKLLKEGEGWDVPDVGDEVEGIVIIHSIFFIETILLAFCEIYFFLLFFCNLQFIIPERCLMEPSSILAATGVPPSSLLSDKVSVSNSLWLSCPYCRICNWMKFGYGALIIWIIMYCFWEYWFIISVHFD